MEIKKQENPNWEQLYRNKCVKLANANNDIHHLQSRYDQLEKAFNDLLHTSTQGRIYTSEIEMWKNKAGILK